MISQKNIIINISTLKEICVNCWHVMKERKWSCLTVYQAALCRLTRQAQSSSLLCSETTLRLTVPYQCLCCCRNTQSHTCVSWILSCWQLPSTLSLSSVFHPHCTFFKYCFRGWLIKTSHWNNWPCSRAHWHSSHSQLEASGTGGCHNAFVKSLLGSFIIMWS